jgi:molecular chaperone HscA
MALLSIAEPGQSEAPHQHRLAVGIDLGTTNSLVATVRDGSATVLRDDDGWLLPVVLSRRRQHEISRRPQRVILIQLNDSSVKA